MHKLLAKQLKRLGFKEGKFPEGGLEKFLHCVDAAYKEADEEREFLEHTLEVSSQEMAELYEALKQKSQSALAKSEQRYKELATRDMLTGIYNRFAFEDALKRAISHAKRTRSKFALLFMDLNRFKEVNDQYGHDIGDKLLQEIVKRISPSIRTEDIFARIGGDEFVLILGDIEKGALHAMTQKILDLFREPWVIEGISLMVTASIGVALFPDDGDTMKELMKKADKAMYRSKELGHAVLFYHDMTN